MGRKRRKKKWVDPEVLARRAERRARGREEERRSLRGLRVIVVLACVGFGALLTLGGLSPEFTPPSEYRFRDGERQTIGQQLAYFAMELGAKIWVAGLRKAGLSDGWIGGLAGVVLVGCVGGIGMVWWRAGRNGGKDAARREENSAR